VKKHLLWTVGHSKSPDVKPDVTVKASVPGNANLDWAVGVGLPDWKYGANYKQFKQTEDHWWLYETQIPAVDIEAGETLRFVAEGIDYEYKIFLDGTLVREHEGMFSPVSITLEGSKSYLLQIWIAPPPKDDFGEKDTRTEAAQSCKPAVSYGWDWHPRLIPSGMWEDAYITVLPACYFTDTFLEYELNDDFTSAEVKFVSDIKGYGESELTLYDPAGKEVLKIPGGESASLESPQLWWCNGYGDPVLYTWEAVLTCGGVVTDKKSGTVGFRKAELVMNEGAWLVPFGFPLGRSPAPITILLNGTAVFAKGSNWVNPEIFTGTITRDTYLPLIKQAKLLNFNILRCWGGAIINKNAFFELCDEYGIMVWQDFPLACNDYRGTPRYLKVLEQEASAIIKRLKNYACLVLWCGGNELFNNWSMMTDQSKALRLLNKLCYEQDPDRPFIMTSPIDGMGHGNYMFRYQDGREVYQVMPEAQKTAYTEFGVPSISGRACIDMFAQESDIFPMVPNEITTAHHAFGAWEGDFDSWSFLGTLRDYFGEAQTLDDLIDWSNRLQGEGYKCIFEEARRQKPFCSMALNWCYNEPWPTLANNSIISYPAEPKASFNDVAEACRPKLISARIPKFAWSAGELFSVELWLLNDSHTPIMSGSVDVTIELNGKIYPLTIWNHEGTDANTNRKGPICEMILPEIDVSGFTELVLNLKSGELSSKYRLHYN